MCCFDLYLINIFTKSMKSERCKDIMFKLALYCLSVTVADLNLQWRYRYEDINILVTRYSVPLYTTLGARQVHDTSVCLIFPALNTYSKLFLALQKVWMVKFTPSHISKASKIFNPPCWGNCPPYYSYLGNSRICLRELTSFHENSAFTSFS